MSELTVPSGWQLKPLRGLAQINYGRDPSAILDPYGTYPVYGTADTGRIGTSYLYDGESLILGRKGSIDRVKLAAGRFWTIDTAYFLSDFVECLPKWLYYFLCRVDIRSLNEATGVPSLSREVLYRIPVLTPPPAEQAKIVEVLSTMDQAIEHTEALIAKQQRIKTGLMQDLLTLGIDEQGNLRSEATHKFKDSPLGRIPVEWHASTIGNYCKVKRGASPRPIQDPKWWGGEAGWVRIADVTASRKYLRTTTQQLSPLGVRHSVLLDPGEVILSICATIGRPIITTYPVCIHDGFVWFDGLSDEIEREWFYYYLHGKEDEFSGRRQVGTQGNLNTGIVSNTALLMPIHRDEQERIAGVLRAIDEKLDRYLNGLEKLARLKTGLMQDLLTGNRRVIALLEEGAPT